MTIKTSELKGIIFDLDGVLVDTARFHYLAWKDVANKYDMTFTEEDNERLKGVSRARSFDIILELNNRSFSEQEIKDILVEKNDYYLSLISTLSTKDILPGVEELIAAAENNGLKIALGSASKNAKAILSSTGLISHFDFLVDGNMVSKAKPDPEVFLTAASLLGLEPKDCLVVEDAEAGIEAALAAGMQVVGVGCERSLNKATLVVNTLTEFSIQQQ